MTQSTSLSCKNDFPYDMCGVSFAQNSIESSLKNKKEQFYKNINLILICPSNYNSDINTSIFSINGNDAAKRLDVKSNGILSRKADNTIIIRFLLVPICALINRNGY